MHQRLNARGLDLSEFKVFSIVRHPLDRFASLYNVYGPQWECESMGSFIEMNPPEKHQFCRPQYDWLQLDGQLAVPFVEKYEDMIGDVGLRRIGEYIGVELPDLPKQNHRKEKPDYRTLYLPDERREVNVMYTEDYATWGYEP